MKEYKRDMRVPDFIGVGAQKAGTSWIHACLYEHPEIYVPASKELHFFSKFYDKGMEWYSNHFLDAAPGQVVGEFSPTYLYSPDAPKRIFEHFPNVKLLVCLRDPVERTRSAYRYAIQHGGVPLKLDIANVIREKPAFLEHSLYHAQIERYLEHFERDQLHVVLYEDMMLDPVAAMQAIYEFIGVEPSYYPTMAHRRVNESGGPPRSRLMDTLMKRSATSLRKAGYGDLVWRVGRSRFAEALRKLNTRPPARSELTAQMEVKLRQLFAADIDALSELLQRDLYEIWPGYKDGASAV